MRASLSFTTDNSDYCEWRLMDSNEVMREPEVRPRLPCDFCCLEERSVSGLSVSQPCQDLRVQGRCGNNQTMDQVTRLT